MATYRVDSGSSVTVQARSSIHDTECRWDKVTGTIEASTETLESNGATATFTVDMSSFDAGDWLKNRKLKKDLDLGHHPTAEFELRELRDFSRGGSRNDEFEAVAVGVLRYRGREKSMEIKGRGSVTESAIEATGSFDMNIRDFGMEPPKILMFKVSPEVTISITLSANV